MKAPQDGRKSKKKKRNADGPDLLRLDFRELHKIEGELGEEGRRSSSQARHYDQSKVVDVDLIGVNRKFYGFRQNSLDPKASAKHKQPFLLDGLKLAEQKKLQNPKCVQSQKEYNGLRDRHLRHFFLRGYKVMDLRKSGIIDSEGNMMPSFQLLKFDHTPSIQSSQSQQNMLANAISPSKGGLIGLDLANSKKTSSKTYKKLKIKLAGRIAKKQGAGGNRDSQLEPLQKDYFNINVKNSATHSAANQEPYKGKLPDILSRANQFYDKA